MGGRCKRALSKPRINCVFEVPQTKTNNDLLTLFQYPIAPTTFVDCELSLGNAVAHSGTCFVPYGGPTRFNMHYDGPADTLPPIQFSCAPCPPPARSAGPHRIPHTLCTAWLVRCHQPGSVAGTLALPQ